MKGQAIFTAALLSKAIEVGLYIAFLMYLGKLEQIGCDCALNWRRTFIITYVVVALVIILSSLLTTSLKANAYIAVLLTGFRLAFIVIAIQYVNKLKKDKCECSQHLTREILYYYAWIAAVLVAVGLLSIATILFLAYTRR